MGLNCESLLRLDVGSVGAGDVISVGEGVAFVDIRADFTNARLEFYVLVQPRNESEGLGWYMRYPSRSGLHSVSSNRRLPVNPANEPTSTCQSYTRIMMSSRKRLGARR